MSTEVIVLGGGCFWCVEAVMRRLEGVEKVVSGYAGGSDPNPDYRSVCSGKTGHAEVVEVSFDPDVISMEDILEVFLTTHDPTTLNRQGADVGTQYRSIILATNDSQESTVKSVISRLETAGTWSAPVVTEIGRLETFHPAEKEHQVYFDTNPYQPYCMAVIAPKVNKLREKHLHRMKSAAR